MSFADRIGPSEFAGVVHRGSARFACGESSLASIGSGVEHASMDDWNALPVYSAYQHAWPVLRELGTCTGIDELIS